MADHPKPAGEFIIEDGHEWYQINHFDLLDPFLVTVVSPHDHWMYVSSSGALTAGRRNAQQALFPYETDDRLHRNGGLTGPITMIRTGQNRVWQPFAPHAPFGQRHRSMAKSALGDRLRFSEYDPESGLRFSYTWAAAGQFGLARTCEIKLEDGRPPVDIDLLDGLVDVLPAGVELPTQQATSTLVDSYRRSELDPTSGLALFSLEARVSDQTEPAESLHATTVWSSGLSPDVTVALSDLQLRAFRSGDALRPEPIVKGRKGAYLISTSRSIVVGNPLRWVIVADVEQDHLAVASLRLSLATSAVSEVDVQASQDKSRNELIGLVAPADALQETADRRTTVHHFANVLFNCMRGGSFQNDHQIALADLDRFMESRNVGAHARFGPIRASLSPFEQIDSIRTAVANDPELRRLVNEYLPLTFSRRHGDPSRPWNTFEISHTNTDGELIVGYEGNWRDIFQNLDALVHSFPNYIESVIAKFLNASTLDGHNPYRISSTGVDWERPDGDTWSNIGYWGDHQIVYLHRLLDAANRFHPCMLEGQLDLVGFSYADAPYRIRPYSEMVTDPKHTIVFDDEVDQAIARRVSAIGTDGQLVPDSEEGSVHHGSLAEKLLVPALAKLSNLIAGGGIWMNTQRPEWNDANNALVGNGVSVVTAFHLHAYIDFVDGLLERTSVDQVPVAKTVLDWLNQLEAAFEAHADLAGDEPIDDVERRKFMDILGTAFSDYRSDVYESGPGEATIASVAQLRKFFAVARPHLDRIVRSASRDDGLFDSYRLVRLDPGTAALEELYEMLEGQVAALDATPMTAEQTVGLVDALFASDLHRPDQQTFLLYPNRPIPPFLDKNAIPESAIGPTITAMVQSGAGPVRRDVDGVVRFDGQLSSPRDLASLLDELEAYPSAAVALSAEGRQEILDAWEAVFHHLAFTGRSQTMYRYEGLGSVYWHMVSKLVFALQERVAEAVEAGDDPALVAELAERYRKVRSGLGFMKSVEEQGTFPTDPHSHTPAHTGAQQPGMTGQVKEGVLLRWGELGLRVSNGALAFRPVVLDPAEFLVEARPWSVLGQDVVLEAGSLGFTYCGVVVVYRLVDGAASTVVTWSSGEQTTSGPELDNVTSQALFARTGAIDRIEVDIPRTTLLT